MEQASRSRAVKDRFIHYVVDRGLPLPIVQKQVGHRSLKTTSVYLSASTEKMAQAHSEARKATDPARQPAAYAE